ncbi:hypothetical protein D910_09464, partial [Dendroctonus ponderosae]
MGTPKEHAQSHPESHASFTTEPMTMERRLIWTAERSVLA